MVKVGDIIYRIFDLYYQGTPTNSSRKRMPLIYGHVKALRASLIKERIDAGIKMSDEFFTTFTIDLELVDYGDQKVLRSVNLLPDIITMEQGHVGTIDGGIYYTPINKSAVVYQKASKYASKSYNYFIEDDRLYLIDDEIKKCIQVRTIIEDPIAIDTSCALYQDLPLYVDENMADTIYLMYLSKYFSTARQIMSDKTGNNIPENE